MAAKKKKFVPKGRPQTDEQIRAAFIADLLDGTIKAEKLYESRAAGRLTLDYDDPNG